MCSIATISSGATACQNIFGAEAVFCNPAFISAVDAAGYPEMVLVMLQSWQAYLVSDIHGATLESRSVWFHERSLPVSQVNCVWLYILDMCVLSHSKCTCMPDANRQCNLSLFHHTAVC